MRLPTPRELWFERLDRAIGTRERDLAGDPSGEERRLDPFVGRLFNQLLCIRANVDRLMTDPDEPLAESWRRPPRWVENPYHREPADEDLIEQGTAAVLERMGEHLGIGPPPS